MDVGLSCLRWPQREHRDLRPHAVRELQAEADALVDVDGALAVAIEAGGKAAPLGSQRYRADAGKVDLAAVRVAAEHQVAAMRAEALDGARVVRQDDARRIGAQAGEGGF